MTCPGCFATTITGPRFGAAPGGGRRNAVARCLACGALIALSARRGQRSFAPAGAAMHPAD